MLRFVPKVVIFTAGIASYVVASVDEAMLDVGTSCRDVNLAREMERGLSTAGLRSQLEGEYMRDICVIYAHILRICLCAWTHRPPGSGICDEAEYDVEAIE